MKLKTKILTILTICALTLSACNLGDHAISANITNATSPGSSDATFHISYLEETNYKDKYTDILLCSDSDNVTFQIKAELENFITITLPEKNNYYSLTTLIANRRMQKTSYTKYTDALSKNYIINSIKDFNLSVKCIVGDIDENNNVLINKTQISNPFTLKIKKIS